MRIRTVAVLLALVSGAAVTLRGAGETPRLAVLIVVDQMRADYIDRFEPDWTGGLKRLVTRGARFRRAAYPYLTTVTCAGHATIGSGALPAAHGIFQNVWFDRATGRLTPCTNDLNAKAVAYGGATGSDGDSPAALMIPSLGDEMRRQRQSQVVTLALKARSAIMLAGHGGTAVTWLADSLDAWQTSTAYASAPVPEVDAYVAAHKIEADFGKTWERLLPPGRYRQPDAGIGEAPPRGWGNSFPHALRGGGTGRPDREFYTQWEDSPFADAYIADMAASLAESMQLGKDDVPDLLGVSFSTPDLIGHAFGPDSQEIQDIYAHLDRTLGRLFDRLDASVGPDRYVVALSADHGVTSIPELLKSRGQDAGRVAVVTMQNAIESVAAQKLGTSGPFIARSNGNDIYFLPGKYEALAQNESAMQAVMKVISEQPGIMRVFRSDELRNAGNDHDALKRAAALSYVPGRSGDLILALKPGWMFSAAGTTHGTANPDDQRVPILFYGAGIKAGSYDDEATPADIAPTLAALVGVSLPSATGRALGSALASPATPSRR
jgi:predicted AlkP superfamily pyrophosphatase or phosphodiesterase